jgi:hypothetical protein
MSQEANPYLVTSVGSMTRMYDDHSSDNPMKKKHERRIWMKQMKAESKAAPTRMYDDGSSDNPVKHQNKEYSKAAATRWYNNHSKDQDEADSKTAARRRAQRVDATAVFR